MRRPSVVEWTRTYLTVDGLLAGPPSVPTVVTQSVSALRRKVYWLNAPGAIASGPLATTGRLVMLLPDTSKVPAFAVNGLHTSSISSTVTIPLGGMGRGWSLVTSV